MLIDLNQIARAPERKYDVCVIGAGAAGITVALRLAELGKSVALCEGGAFDYSEASQGCYAGDVIGDPYFDLEDTRLRYFGGSTNHWGGWCRTFEKEDFERHVLGEEFTWPIAHDAMSTYFRAASEILELDGDYDDRIVNRRYGIKNIQFKFSPPVKFGAKYKGTISRSRNIDLYINANFAGVSGAAGRVRSVNVRNYSDATIALDTDKVVLAMGGIENSRQLLWIREQHGSRFFDETLPIGRYWMEHPHFTLGEALVENSVSQGTFYALSGEAQNRLGILGCGLRIERRGPLTTKRLIDDLLCAAPAAGRWAADLAGRGLVCGVRFRAAWEQAPDIGNRVALSSTRNDRFGVPLTRLHWRKTPMDRKTVELSANQFNLWLLDRDLGRVRLDEWVHTKAPYPSDDELAGYHHMGGTRMAASKRLGVVDADCRVFGSDNIYVAGSSVFSTSGHNNPTLPIVQLSLRLADHLVSTT